MAKFNIKFIKEDGNNRIITMAGESQITTMDGINPIIMDGVNRTITTAGDNKIQIMVGEIVLDQDSKITVVGDMDLEMVMGMDMVMDTDMEIKTTTAGATTMVGDLT